MENKSFTEKLVARAQALAPTDPFAEVAADYLRRHNRLAHDDARDLFWIIMPNGPPQVAVFMIVPTDAEKRAA